MSDNVYSNQNIAIKCESKEIIQCQNIINNHNDFSSLHKDLSLSPLNYDIENVDLESINIDDIFNDNQIQESWCMPKDEYEKNCKHKNELTTDNLIVLSNVFNPGDTNSLSFCNSNDGMPLAKYNKINPCADDKFFFITDILNKDKVCLNSQYYPNTSCENRLNIMPQNEYQHVKPHLTLLLNPNHNEKNEYVDNSVIRNDKISQQDSMVYMQTTNSPLNIIPISNPNVSNRISKPKTILPIIGPSPRKKALPIKAGKFSSQLCGICSDNATGKHYGVISCEGCKGFFKRTVRNSLSYICRDFNNCAVDKKFRNRCQACRFQKCLQVGMKREAVQIERPEKRLHKSLPDNSETVISSPSSVQTDESLEKIHSNLICQINSDYMMQIEIKYNPDVEVKDIFEGNVMKVICQHLNEHLFSIVSWAKYMPGFTVLSLHDQTLLIKMCWGELVVANFTHRSLKLNGDVILLRNGMKLVREIAEISGMGKLIDRIIHEILHRFRDLKIDRCELSFMKGIILFNPNLKDLENRSFVQMIRDRLYTSLQSYCLEKFPTEKFRFSKLLLRLPSLRSIAHHCLNHFRLYDIIDKCKSEFRDDDDSGNNDGKASENELYSFLDEMLGHSDIIMDH